MDRETLSHYGWIAICCMIMAVMLAFATPLGDYVKDVANGVLGGFVDTNEGALSEENMNNIVNDWENEFLYNTQTIEDIKVKYELVYYPTIEDAINGTNPTTEANSVFGTYYESGVLNIVLLKDTTIEPIEIDRRTVINLAGNTLKFSSSPGLTVNAHLTIEGALEGSELISEQTFAQGRLAYVKEGGKLTLNKGTYTMKTTGCGNTSAFYVEGDMEANSVNINVSEVNGKTYGIELASTGYADLENTKIFAVATSGRSYGVSGSGKLEAVESEFIAYSNFGESNANGYTSMSSGISVSGEINLKDCKAYGTHSGISASGTVEIDGGDYSGYNCGGIYVSGPNSTNYIKNANFSEGAMPEGYVDESGGNNKAAMYIGGSAGRDNITLYVDNCTFTGARQPIVLRGTSGEKNNTLYISNSTINLDYTSYGIRIDNDTMSVFMGAENNFTANNTNRKARVSQTTATYTK